MARSDVRFTSSDPSEADVWTIQVQLPSGDRSSKPSSEVRSQGQGAAGRGPDGDDVVRRAAGEDGPLTSL